MTDEWPSVRLGEVADLVTGFPFRSERYVDDIDAPRLLRGDNIVQGALRWDGAKRWPKDDTDDYADFWLREGDIVLAMDRPWIEAGLKYASVRRSDLPSLLVQRVARLRGKELVDTHFLKYIVGSRSFTEHVLAVQTGTGVPHISGGQIKDFKFSLPSLSEQRAIAYVLGTMDDKVELNRRMIETLAATAVAIFKSWFLDFGPVRAKAHGRDPGLPPTIADLFPDSLEYTDYGEIPKGWQIKRIGDLVAQVKSRIGDEQAPEYSATVNGLTLRDNQFNKQLSKSSNANKKIEKDDLVFGLSSRSS